MPGGEPDSGDRKASVCTLAWLPTLLLCDLLCVQLFKASVSLSIKWVIRVPVYRVVRVKGANEWIRPDT